MDGGRIATPAPMPDCHREHHSKNSTCSANAACSALVQPVAVQRQHVVHRGDERARFGQPSGVEFRFGRQAAGLDARREVRCSLRHRREDRQSEAALADGVQLDRFGEPELRDVGADDRRRAFAAGDAPERAQERVVRRGALAPELSLGQAELGGDQLGRLPVDLTAQQRRMHPAEARAVAVVFVVRVQRAERFAHQAANPLERNGDRRPACAGASETTTRSTRRRARCAAARARRRGCAADAARRSSRNGTA